jgi:uncharacterized RDD family membrane protein YckC
MPCKNHPFIDDRLTRCTRCGDSFCPDCIVQIGGYSYCAECKEEAMRDLRSGLVANQVRPLEMAGLSRRLLAIMVDFLVLMIPLMLLMFAIALPSGIFFKEMGKSDPSPAFLAFQGLLTLGYMGFGIAYEGVMLSNGGQTVGKKLLKIKVVTPDGNDITSGQAWTRSVVRQVLGAVPCLGLVDYLVVFGDQRTCIHDQAARTRVVTWNP